MLLTTHYLEEAEALAQRVAVLVNGHIVTEGTVDEIRAMGVRRHIRCVSSLSVAQVREWAGVDAVSGRGNWLDIEVRIAEPIMRQLLAADPSLRELEVTRAGVAEAFVQITKGSMQRGATHASQGLTPKAQPRTYTERAVLTQGETV